MTMIPHDIHLRIGSLLFEGVDQIDLTGPFEVLSRYTNATYRVYGKTAAPVRDLKGFWLTPDATLADAPPLDVLHVPGSFGQEALMDDAEVLGWFRSSGRRVQHLLGVHRRLLWARLACQGTPRDDALGVVSPVAVSARFRQRTRVVDGAWVFAAGVTAGSTAPCASRPSCAATRPHRPSNFTWSCARAAFDSGTPETAPAAILEEARRSVRAITAQREQTARRVAAKLGIAVLAAGSE